MAPESSHRLKFTRGENHLKTLETAIEGWQRSRPYRLAEQFNAEKNLREVKVQDAQQPGLEISLIIGDAAHAFRCALDHIYFALAAQGRTLTRKEERGVAFPISKTPGAFTDAITNNLLHLLPKDAQTVVADTQPCRAGDADRHPLWALKQLDDLDKHRRVSIAGAFVYMSGFAVGGGSGNIEYLEAHGTGRLKNDAIVIEYRGLKGQMNVQAGFTPQVAFGEGSPWTDDPVLPGDVTCHE